MKMKMFFLTRLDSVGYDEYDGFVIVAGTEQDARNMANEWCGDEGGIWTDKKIVRCKTIRKNARAGVVLASFNAG